MIDRYKQYSYEAPLVSVIMAVYNGEDTIEEAILSVVSQSYKNIEFIIIDGKSTDNSVTIAQKYSSYISHLVSELDQGVYDAWNKAVSLSKGAWLCFMGADDRLKSHAIDHYVTFINQYPTSQFDYISSRVALINASGTVRETVGSAWDWQKYKHYMNVAHVGSFHAKKLFEEIGLFDLTYKIIADYELLLRKGPSLKTGYMHTVTADMTVGGISDSRKVLQELKELRIKKLGYTPVYANFMYSLAILSRYIRQFLISVGIQIRLKT
ncbi:glycosyltransferase family 2 protein [Fibrella sp. ES10-3-2-2]|nr:hypothetical protein A6C57_05880 [Fibrella sp. ES10-3-2-2]